jgi:hypothetical protein
VWRQGSWPTAPKTDRMPNPESTRVQPWAESQESRIGTWNLDGKWTYAHRELMIAAACDVWLLTEVSPKVELEGFERQLTAGVMGRGQHWAGVFAREPLKGLPEPHPASAAAVIAGVTYCSSILPWRGMGRDAGWPGDSHEEWTQHAIDRLLGQVLTRGSVWGGDWNHGIFGPESAGSKGGRRHLFAALSKLELNVPTAHLPHRIRGLLSIDHIAVPPDWAVVSATRLSAEGLSDHDCYVVDVRVDRANESLDKPAEGRNRVAGGET